MNNVTTGHVVDFFNQFKLSVHVSHHRQGVSDEVIPPQELTVKYLAGLPLGSTCHIFVPTTNGRRVKLFARFPQGWREYALGREVKNETVH